MTTEELITKLRQSERAVAAAGLPLESSIYKAAADEIERLETEVAALQRELDLQ